MRFPIGNSSIIRSHSQDKYKNLIKFIESLNIIEWLLLSQSKNNFWDVYKLIKYLFWRWSGIACHVTFTSWWYLKLQRTLLAWNSFPFAEHWFPSLHCPHSWWRLCKSVPGHVWLSSRATSVHSQIRTFAICFNSRLARLRTLC